jgi:predicted Zn-dependent protease
MARMLARFRTFMSCSSRTRSLLPVLLTTILAGCATVPITGRSQLSLVSSPQMMSMSEQNYRAFLDENRGAVLTGTAEARMVERTGQRIRRAVEQYFASRGMSDRLRGYAWEFHLVDKDEVNAWCMPGGKVVVYRGLLPVAQDETGLAVVMGHEIAHAIAEHGNERMSQELMVRMGGSALSMAVATRPAATQSLFMSLYGAGTKVGALLPYSRLHESEADRLGLIFMAIADYDPRAAEGFWSRMSQSKKGATASPEMLSTHPSDASRIAQIRQLLPEALAHARAVRRGLPVATEDAAP